MSKDNCKVLYVDDHDDSASMLKLVFAPVQVQTASTFDEAIELATNENFDLYVLDSRLPDGSGIELVRRLAAITPGVRCIFYSGDTYGTHRAEAIAAGVVAYVTKPDVEELIDTVHRFLSERDCGKN